MREFCRLDEKLVLPQQSGEWTLDIVKLTEAQVRRAHMHAMYDREGFAYLDRFLKADYPYVVLKKGRTVWMSNTPLETFTNQEFLHQAKGKVFIAGLGIGLLITPLLEDPEVTSIDVVEIEPEVIEVWNKASADLDTSKLTIHQGNAFKPGEFLGDVKFNSLYFDIWSTVCSDNYPETKELYKLYRKHIDYKTQKPVVDFWVRSYIKRQHLRYG